MAEKIHVRPKAGAAIVFVHPVDGPIATAADDAGNWSFWTQDQLTLALLRDGAIERVPAPQPSHSPATKGRKADAAAE
jgi:hypothetical protein